MTTPIVELDRADWARLRRRHPHLRVLCHGKLRREPCGLRIFVCRQEVVPGEASHAGFACGQYCCSCEGGSDDNRCSACHGRLHAAPGPAQVAP